jgi:hypothetical protein
MPQPMMPSSELYEYQAWNKRREYERGRLVASSPEDAKSQLRERGLRPMAVWGTGPEDFFAAKPSRLPTMRKRLRLRSEDGVSCTYATSHVSRLLIGLGLVVLAACSWGMSLGAQSGGNQPLLFLVASLAPVMGMAGLAVLGAYGFHARTSVTVGGAPRTLHLEFRIWPLIRRRYDVPASQVEKVVLRAERFPVNPSRSALLPHAWYWGYVVSLERPDEHPFQVYVSQSLRDHQALAESIAQYLWVPLETQMPEELMQNL